MKSSKNINVLILTEGIEKIWNRVYSVNESMTVSERKELIRGFEDGINEGIGSLLGRAWKSGKELVGGAKQAWNAMAAKVKEYYEKGKKLAGEAWEKMKEFAGSVMQKIKESYSKAIESITTSYQSFKLAISNAYQEALKSINSAYESMKDKAAAFAEACKGIWSDILEESALLIQATKDKLSAMKEGVNEWFAKNKAELEKSVIQAKSSSIDSMKRLGDLASGALAKASKTAAEIGEVAIVICVLPIIAIVEGIKAIPGVYDSAVEMVNNYVEKQVADFRKMSESLRYIKTFENFKHYESLERGQIIFSGETKNGWKYIIVSTDGSRDELKLTSERGSDLDASEMLHEAVDAYIEGGSSTKGFFVDVEDITEAYDKMMSLVDHGSSLDGLVTMEDI